LTDTDPHILRQIYVTAMIYLFAVNTAPVERYGFQGHANRRGWKMRDLKMMDQITRPENVSTGRGIWASWTFPSTIWEAMLRHWSIQDSSHELCGRQHCCKSRSGKYIFDGRLVCSRKHIRELSSKHRKNRNNL